MTRHLGLDQVGDSGPDDGFQLGSEPGRQQEVWRRAVRLVSPFRDLGDEYAELETGDTRLSFAVESLAATHGFTITPNRPGANPAGFEIALVTNDVQAAYDKAVAAGATPTSPPETKPWGQVVGYVSDPNGILVELCSPIED